LNVSNFALTRQSDVQALSNIIASKRATLHYLKLERIECNVDDCHKEESDEPNGFLDPVFYAASGVNEFWVSTKPRSVHSTLVSPRALRALFIEGRQLSLRLKGLGLTDSHVVAIVDGLPTAGIHLDYLNLELNPGISAQGYGALFNLVNQANVFSRVTRCYFPRGFHLEDKAWEGKLNLLSEMNFKYGRLDYMANGTFISKEHKWQWLEQLADRISREEAFDRGNIDYEGRKKKRDAKYVNFIWYTLCQNPEMMQVFLAQTRKRKRKSAPSTSTLFGTHSVRIQKR
jgi:hypothetical protein